MKWIILQDVSLSAIGCLPRRIIVNFEICLDRETDKKRDGVEQNRKNKPKSNGWYSNDGFRQTF